MLASYDEWETGTERGILKLELAMVMSLLELCAAPFLVCGRLPSGNHCNYMVRPTSQFVGVDSAYFMIWRELREAVDPPRGCTVAAGLYTVAYTGFVPRVGVKMSEMFAAAGATGSFDASDMDVVDA